MPNHLRDANRDKEGFGHGEGYDYPHSHPDHHTGQQYLPDAVLGTYFYSPSNQGYEQAIAARLAEWRAAQAKALGITETRSLPPLDKDNLTRLMYLMRRQSSR